MHAGQLLRFCAVGGLCYVVGMVVLIGLCELAGVHYVVAYLAAFLATNTLGFLLNGRFTFASANIEQASMLRYILVNISLLVFNTLALSLLVEVFHVWYVAATALLAAVNTPVSFFAHRVFSYRIGGVAVGNSGSPTNR